MLLQRDTLKAYLTQIIRWSNTAIKTMILRLLKSLLKLEDRLLETAIKRILIISNHIATITLPVCWLNLKRILKTLIKHLVQQLSLKRKAVLKVFPEETQAMVLNVINVVCSTVIQLLQRNFKSSMTIRISQMRFMRSGTIEGLSKALTLSLLLTNLNLLEALSFSQCL